MDVPVGLRRLRVFATSWFVLVVAVLFAPAAWAGEYDWEPPPWRTKVSVAPQQLLGARANLSTLSRTSDSFGGGVGLQGSTYELWNPFTSRLMISTRLVSNSSIGTSRHGLEGFSTGDLGMGVTYLLGVAHGPVLRIGLRGHGFGNDAVWLSNFEAPLGQLGYQYQSGRVLFEIAGRGGFIVDGRHTIYGQLQGFEVLQRRRLGGEWEYGGHMALGVGRVQLEGELMYIGVRDGISAPQVVASGSLCWRPGTFGVCADYRRWDTRVRMIDGVARVADVSFGGVSLGVWTP